MQLKRLFRNQIDRKVAPLMFHGLFQTIRQTVIHSVRTRYETCLQHMQNVCRHRGRGVLCPAQGRLGNPLDMVSISPTSPPSNLVGPQPTNPPATAIPVRHCDNKNTSFVVVSISLILHIAILMHLSCNYALWTWPWYRTIKHHQSRTI